jgi:hypothetical protein
MAKAAAPTNQINVPFSLIHTPIDYFKLEESYFKPDFNVTKHLSKLTTGQYFTLGSNFKPDDKETVVFNLQVGQGKTTLCYDLIEQYEKSGYCVIVCSPYIKLVNKDYEEIKKRVEKFVVTGGIKGYNQKVFRYDDVNSLNHWGDLMKDVAAHTHTVHVMTINCLLGNPGNNAYEQAFNKQDYLKDLIDVAKRKGQKVVLFIDEIHESISNFSPSLIPNLLKWNGLVNKVFIASATFTPATVPVIKAFSLLTDKNIRIFETERIKNKTQADIHLHVCSVPVFPVSEYEKIIKDQIKQYQQSGKNVNIITGIKATAENIAESDVFSKVYKSEPGIGNFSVNEINLLTGDTEIGYKKGQNNIGTTFKTGINIDASNDVLFVVFPNLSRNATEYYGTFSDGITSIIQSIGRLRNGGEIHLFINDPKSLIGNKQDYDLIFENRDFATHLPVNELYEELKIKYESGVKRISNEIAEMEKGFIYSKSINVEVLKKQFGFHYPNEHEYFLSDGQSFALRHDNFSFGRLLAPYVMWACNNDQFINGTLKTITFHSKASISLNKSNAETTFNKILGQHTSTLKGVGFRESIKDIGKFLSKAENDNGETELLNYNIDGKPTTTGEMIGRKPAYLNALAKTTFKICTDSKFPDTKEEYINACINEAQRSKTSRADDLIKGFSDLGSLKLDFINRVKSSIKVENNSNYILSDNDAIIDDSFFNKAMAVIETLKEHDSLIKFKAVSFMQDNFPGKDKKKRVYKLFADLFLHLGSKKQIDNKQHVEVKEFDPMANISFPGLL